MAGEREREGYPKIEEKAGEEDSVIETDEAAGLNINQYKWTILDLCLLCLTAEIFCWKVSRKEMKLTLGSSETTSKIKAVRFDW